MTNEPDYASRERLIEEAESYQSCGQALPLDLYAALMEQGVNASLYNNIRESDEENDNE